MSSKNVTMAHTLIASLIHNKLVKSIVNISISSSCWMLCFSRTVLSSQITEQDADRGEIVIWNAHLSPLSRSRITISLLQEPIDMLWKILVGLAAFLLPQGSDRLDVSPEHPITPYGPRSRLELSKIWSFISLLFYILSF